MKSFILLLILFHSVWWTRLQTSLFLCLCVCRSHKNGITLNQRAIRLYYSVTSSCLQAPATNTSAPQLNTKNRSRRSDEANGSGSEHSLRENTPGTSGHPHVPQEPQACGQRNRTAQSETKNNYQVFSYLTFLKLVLNLVKIAGDFWT